jgi:hypothetical protein
MVEMAHMARMAAARPTATTATRQGGLPNCSLARGKDQHRSQSQRLIRHGGRSGEFEARPVTLSLRPGFHIRQVGLVLQFQGGRWSIGLSSADAGQSGRCFRRATCGVGQARQHPATCITHLHRPKKHFLRPVAKLKRARVVSVPNNGEANYQRGNSERILTKY